MRSFKLLAGVVFLMTVAFAQSDRSQITGTVFDPAGAVVANAPVRARNVDTGGEYNAVSTSTGNYALNELPVGRYQLTVAAPGFKTFVRDGFTVQSAQVYRIDIPLEVGAASESVTVTAEAPLLNTESGELSRNVSSANLNKLPVLGIGSAFASNSGVRQPLAVTALIPGGIFVGDNVIRLNGTPSNTQSVRVEGQDSTNYTWVNAVSQNQPSVDSIEEFQVQTSNYSAEFGKAGGGVFLVTMKSGNNKYHGSAYNYFVNEALNASTPFVNAKPRARRNDYGFTFGGPAFIPKVYDGHDKTFYFFNFEQFRETAVVNNSPVTVPTAQYRVGDFAQALTARSATVGGVTYREGTIFDPATQATINGRTSRTAFVNNAIPVSRFDPVALAIQKLVPNPTDSNALFQNYLPSFGADRRTDITSLKLDQNMGSKGKLSGFYSLTRTISNTSVVLGADGLPDPISQARANFDWVHTIRINYDYSLTPTMLLHIGVGYVNQRGPSSYLASRNNFDPNTIGLTGLQNTGVFPRISGLTGANNTGGLALLGQATAGTGFKSFRPSGNISLTWTKNNHTFKFGGENIVGNYIYGNLSNTRGVFNYSANSTSDPATIGQAVTGSATIGFPYASFLLGATDSYTIGPPTNQHHGEQAYAGFAQDTWKVTRRLTVDYGIRYDFQTYLREGAGRMPSFSPTAVNPNIGRLGGTIFDGYLPGRCQCTFGKNYPFGFGPRLGIAYQVNGKTVLRGGFGIVYNKTAALNNLTVVGNDKAFSSPGQFVPSFYLKDGIKTPYGQWPNFDPGQFPTTPGGAGPTGYGLIDPGIGRPARQMQWSVGLQRELLRNLVVEASYVGNRGAWWQAPGLTTYNAISNQALASAGLDINSPTDQALLRGGVRSTGAIQRGFGLPYSTFPTSLLLAQSLRPFPQFGDIPALYAPLGSTWYNAFQSTVTKRFSHGLDFTYSFTWQKSLTNGAENATAVITGGAAEQVNDVFNRPINKTLSGYNQPLVSQLTVNYVVPKMGWNGNMGARTLSWVARDWTLGTFLAYRSGQPMRVPGANSNLSALLFRGNSFANRVPGQPLFLADLNDHSLDPARTLYLNPAAWADPPAGQFGSSAAYYNDYRMQRRPTESFNVGRTFRIKETITFNVRGEFSNIFNRTQMNNPSSVNATTAATKNALGVYTNGFGFINTGGTASLPRQGTIVARLQF
jgi:hypothetical protein